MQFDSIQWLVLALVLAAILVAVFLVVRRRSAAATTTTQRRAGTGLAASLRAVWGSELDGSTWDGIEEVLLKADVGVDATTEIVDSVRSKRPETYAEAINEIGSELLAQFTATDRGLSLKGDPALILVVGVNGSGKTTTIAKLAKQLSDSDMSVVLGAGDTFRAAAADQLEAWGSRIGCRVVRGGEGADPASVVHDTISAAAAAGADVAIIDTAGRLHGKKNLMAELEKIYRVATDGGSRPAEVLLVLDATSGQNGLAQVSRFSDSVPLTGIVLTKLDGTARGGIVVAVEKSLGVPIKYVGLGEAVDDLRPFSPDSFVGELLEVS